MSFYGDFEGALWAIATGTSGKEDCDNAQIMRGIAQEALGTAWTDYLNHQKGAKEAFGKVIPFDAPESPQDTDSTETVEADPEEIEPMTDLSGVDYAPAFEGYQPNGHLLETD